MSRPLIITDEIRERIAAIRIWAEQNIEPLSSLVRRMGDADGRRAPGSLNFDKTTIIIPMGYRCCFTIEQQAKGNCRHLSVSVPAPGMVPNEHAMALILHEFGFEGEEVNPWMLYTEHVGAGKAVNVIQFIDRPAAL